MAPPKSRRADDDDDNGDDDRPSKKPKSSGGGSSMLIILLIGGAVLGLCLLCGVGGVVALIVATPTDPKVNVAKKDKGVIAKGDRKRPEAKKFPNVVAKGKVIFTHNGNLTATDPPDPTPELKEVDARMKVHQVPLQTGKTYVITLKSDDFDTYLRVESPKNVRLVEDDDSGGDLNSRIVLQAAETGSFRIIATSYDGEFGRYTLKVQEAN